MTVRLYALPDLGEPPVWTDDERRARHPDDRLAVQHLLAPRPVLRGDLGALVDEERERQVVLRAELLVRGGVVGGDSEDHRARLLDRAEVVAEGARLLGTARGVVLGVEVEDDFLAFEFFEADGSAAISGA